MEVLVNRFSRRANLAEELVDDLILREHREAMRAHDIEVLVRECLELSALVHSTWAHVLELLYSDCVADFDLLHSIMMRSISKTSNAMKRVEQLAQKFTGKGYAIAGASVVRADISKLEQLVLEIEKKWPKCDPELVASSWAAYRRGEYQPIEDLLRDAQGCGSPAR